MGNKEQTIKKIMAVSFLPRLGPQTLKKIIAQWGSVESFVKAGPAEWEQLKGVKQEWLTALTSASFLAKAEAELQWAQYHQLEIVSLWDSAYPKLLKQCPDAPVFLYRKGNFDWNQGKFVSIVGTRDMTSEGKAFVHELVAGLAKQPITIVSGLALGIDGEAHKAALKNKLPTLAVLANPLDQILPHRHRELGQAMQANGGLVSESPSFYKVKPQYFIRRNRIVAGLSHATIVIESKVRGGAMTTARFANDYSRDVFAVPGHRTNENHAGCHQLIKKHQAFLLTEASDVLHYLGLTKADEIEKEKRIEKEEDKLATSMAVETSALTPQEQKVVQVLKANGKQHLDQLTFKTQLAVYELTPILLALEMNKIVRPLAGKYYELF